MNTKCFYIGLAIWTLVFVPFGFTEDFQNRPTLSELNETVEQATVCGNAVSERGLAVNDAGSFLPYCGHGQSYFASLQTELEYLPPSYIDHAIGPLNTNKNDFLFFTLSTWRSVAGLNANGFRRATEQDGTNTPSFVYGHAQAGDVIGYWIYEDIQNGFSALKWTRMGDGYTYPTMEEIKLDWAHVPAGQEAAFIAAWNALSWTYRPPGNSYHVSGGVAMGGPGDWYYSSERTRASQTLAFPDINRSVDIYIKTVGGGEGNSFLDYDAVGFVEGEFKLYRNDSETSALSVTLDYISDVKTCPIEIDSGVHNIHSTDYIRYLIKWNFTNGEN